MNRLAVFWKGGKPRVRRNNATVLINTGSLKYIFCHSSNSLLRRSYHKLYTDLFNAENSKAIRNISGCLKPCHSKEYKQVPENSQPRICRKANFTSSQVFPLTKYSTYGDEVCFISVWMASSDTTLKTEVIQVNQQKTFFFMSNSRLAFRPQR